MLLGKAQISPESPGNTSSVFSSLSIPEFKQIPLEANLGPSKLILTRAAELGCNDRTEAE